MVAGTVIADLIRNTEGRQGDTGEQDNTDRIPLFLDGRGSKPVPVPDTGAEGEINTPTPVTDCTRPCSPTTHTLNETRQ